MLTGRVPCGWMTVVVVRGSFSGRGEGSSPIMTRWASRAYRFYISCWRRGAFANAPTRTEDAGGSLIPWAGVRAGAATRPHGGGGEAATRADARSLCALLHVCEG